jgi:hypothetical protein
MKKILDDSCLFCWKKFQWHEAIIVKYPEWACFWLCCAEKFPDKTEYDLDNEWWIPCEYEPWIYLTKE